MLFQLGVDQPERHPGAVDRDRLGAIHLHDQERQRADVVLVAVRDDDRAEVVGRLADVAEVGDHQIDAVKLRLRELHPASTITI